jgi:hypothetical protein
MLKRLVLVAALSSLALAACGGDDSSSEQPDEPETEPKAERPEEVKGLDQGWEVERNTAQGFSIGAPPGWRKAGDCLGGGLAPGSVTILCSPDKLVTLSIQADRTDEALELDPGEFATRTMTGLADSYDGLESGKPKPFKAHYEGAVVAGEGKAVGSGVDQDVQVVVLRRDGVANFTAVIAANADKPTGPAVKLAEEALETLRSQPVGAPRG